MGRCGEQSAAQRRSDADTRHKKAPQDMARKHASARCAPLTNTADATPRPDRPPERTGVSISRSSLALNAGLLARLSNSRQGLSQCCHTEISRGLFCGCTGPYSGDRFVETRDRNTKIDALTVGSVKRYVGFLH